MAEKKAEWRIYGAWKNQKITRISLRPSVFFMFMSLNLCWSEKARQKGIIIAKRDLIIYIVREEKKKRRKKQQQRKKKRRENVSNKVFIDYTERYTRLCHNADCGCVWRSSRSFFHATPQKKPTPLIPGHLAAAFCSTRVRDRLIEISNSPIDFLRENFSLFLRAPVAPGGFNVSKFDLEFFSLPLVCGVCVCEENEKFLEFSFL